MGQPSRQPANKKQPFEAASHFTEAVIRCSSSAIATCNMEGAMTYGNPAFLKLWGIDQPDEHLGKPFWQFWLVEDRLDEIMQALRTDGVWFDEIKARRKDGTVFDVQVTAATIVDSSGNPIGLTSTSIDCTEHKRIEAALIESEQRLRLAINTAGLTIWDWDITKNTVRWYLPGRSLIDGPMEQENALEWWLERIHADDREAVISKLNTALAQGNETLVMEYRYKRTDSEWSKVLDRSHIRRDKLGRAYQIVGALMDVTELRRAEDELRQAKYQLEQRIEERTVELKNRASQLARLSSELTLAEQRERRRIAEIMHDNLQQLLVAARMNQEMLVDKQDKSLRSEAEHILELIDRSLQATRSLTTELSPAVLRSGNLSASLEWLAKWMADHYGFEVRVKTQAAIILEQKDLTVLLFQSIRELLFNAVKHAGVKSARVEMVRDQEQRLCISVTDEGTGFDPETIWEKSKTGTGFGLFSIRERLNLLGGKFGVVSLPGKGATFSLVVPLQQDEQFL